MQNKIRLQTLDVHTSCKIIKSTQTTVNNSQSVFFLALCIKVSDFGKSQNTSSDIKAEVREQILKGGVCIFTRVGCLDVVFQSVLRIVVLADGTGHVFTL